MLLFWCGLTARLEAHIDQLEDVLRLAKQCHLTVLLHQLEEKIKRVLSFGAFSKNYLSVYRRIICIPNAVSLTCFFFFFIMFKPLWSGQSRTAENALWCWKMFKIFIKYVHMSVCVQLKILTQYVPATVIVIPPL